ncbi:MAG: TetR family transcriptional regulator [Mycobacteriaceae bacterium]|nr:TetR family transcriptional regulator [Mycobacteriaceae bacterium]MBV9640189.1 TetR family transcriptional regulator [Mycobacteriaceae bacterium]
MRVTKEQAAINRQRIVDSAIRLFAERGVDGVGVAEVMADAGFTHGGFYNHFTSKDDLVLHACSTSFARSVASLRRNAAQTRDPDFGECLSAAMLSESSKSDGRLGSVYADGVRQFLDVLTEQYGDRGRAVTGLAGFVGARVISSAVASADPALANEFSAALHPPEQDQPRLQASS